MEQLLLIKSLLEKNFPNTDCRVQSIHNNDVIVMWEVSEDKLYNVLINTKKLIKALESFGPFTDCCDLFLKAGVPKWAIEDFQEQVEFFSKKA